MFDLRYYQREALDETYRYWGEGGGNPLIVMPTGTGKAPTLCTLIKELVTNYDGMRIINLTHVKELIGQNAKTLEKMWPWAPMGVYSAGLGRRELSSQILFAGIQSVAKKVAQLGQVDLCIVDECDLISPNDTTVYRRFLQECWETNPDMRLLGLTATHYRLGTGYIHEGDDAIFDDISYEYKMTQAFLDGWLKPLTTKDFDDVRAVEFDTSGVGKSGGDFVQKQLQEATDQDYLNRAIAESIVRRGRENRRRSWLVFATGEEHARHLAYYIAEHGVTVGVVTGNSKDRDYLISQFKLGEIQCLVNVNVLTVGFDFPGIDLIAFARPTKSLRLYKQMCGRGTRPVWPLDFDPNTATADERRAAMKRSVAPDCLVLDYAKNINEFGPVDTAEPRRPGKKGSGTAPVKSCPKCFSVIHASVMECPDCGHVWERQLSEKITRVATAAPIVSIEAPSFIKVSGRRFYRHEKPGAPASLRVEYVCGLTVHKEWWPIESEAGRRIAETRWREAALPEFKAEPVPETVTEAIARVTELRRIDEIRVEPDGKYYKISGRRYAADGAEDSEAVLAATIRLFDQRFSKPSFDLDDEIPF